jgi:hypothetical protein
VCACICLTAGSCKPALGPKKEEEQEQEQEEEGVMVVVVVMVLLLLLLLPLCVDACVRAHARTFDTSAALATTAERFSYPLNPHRNSPSAKWRRTSAFSRATCSKSCCGG